MSTRKLTKSDSESIDFQEFLMQSGYVLPSNQYNNKLFKSRLWNGFFVGLHKLALVLFYNLINANLQSDDTVARRRMFATHEANRLAQEDESVERAGARGKSAEIGQRIRCERGEKLERPQLEIDFPTRRGYSFVYFLVFQLLVWCHYVIAQFVLNHPGNKKYGVSCSNGLETHQTLVSIIDQPVSLSGAVDDSAGSRASCLVQLESYLLARYGKFYIWNMSVGAFSTPIMEDFLLVEQHPALQMFSDEVSLFCHTIGFFFITSGVLGCLLSQFKPYNVTPMVFAYDPRYSAYLIKSRIQHYLKVVRHSYSNFWSIHQLDCDQATCACLTGRQHYQPKQSRGFHTDHFDDYIPSARDQSWRRVLMIGGPIFKLAATIFVTATLAAMYVLFVRNNNHAVALNQELKLFLQAGVEPPDFDRVVSERVCANLSLVAAQFPNEPASVAGARQELSSFVQWKIIEHLSGALRAINPDLSRLKREPSGTSERALDQGLIDDNLAPTSAVATLTTSETLDEHDEMMLNRRIVLNSISPTRAPTLINWTVPLIGGLMTGIIFALYLVIFFSVIADLCFWLFEIRMKLDICKYLLRLLENQQQQQSTSGLRSASSEGRDDECQAVVRSALSFAGIALFEEAAASGDDFDAHPAGQPTFAPPHFDLGYSSSLLHEFRAHDTGNNSSSSSSFLVPASIRKGAASVRSPATARHRKLMVAPAGGALARSISAYDFPPGSCSSKLDQAEVRRAVTAVCNVDAWQVLQYVASSRSQRQVMCESYARRIVLADEQLRVQHGLRAFKQCADSFLLSAYLNFRLFLEQIEGCRFSINFMISYTVLHALNIIAVSQYTDLLRSKIGFMGCGYVLANIPLIGSSFFQSQCTKLISPIYSLLAASFFGDKTIKHLSSLWHRALTDLSGSRSKFSFRVYSVNISYATALQFNLGVTSLYILTLDKMRYRT